MKDILLQDLEDHTKERLQSLQEYAIILDIIALMNTIVNKLSNGEFEELLVKRIPYVYGRVGIMADCYKTKSIESSEQLSIRRGQSGKIYLVSFFSKVPSDFHNSNLIPNTKTNEFLNSYLNILKEKQNIV